MPAFFGLLAVAAVATAIGVIRAVTPIHSALFLMAHFVTLAVLMLTLQAEFLALVQVVIYAGAIMILFLFVISLLSTSAQAEDEGPDPLRAQRAAAWSLGVIALLMLIAAAAAGNMTRAPIAAGFGGIGAFGQALFSQYALPFEATAVILLIAIVGVVSLKPEHTVGPDEAGGNRDARL